LQLDSNWDAHLADFGLAANVTDLSKSSVENWKSSGKPTGGFHKKNMVGTLLYMAPEILRKEVQSEKSDVYGYGITLKYVYLDRFIFHLHPWVSLQMVLGVHFPLFLEFGNTIFLKIKILSTVLSFLILIFFD
jgi:serine/threonine protein kinase